MYIKVYFLGVLLNSEHER